MFVQKLLKSNLLLPSSVLDLHRSKHCSCKKNACDKEHCCFPLCIVTGGENEQWSMQVDWSRWWSWLPDDQLGMKNTWDNWFLDHLDHWSLDHCTGRSYSSNNARFRWRRKVLGCQYHLLHIDTRWAKSCRKSEKLPRPAVGLFETLQQKTDRVATTKRNLTLGCYITVTT